MGVTVEAEKYTYRIEHLKRTSASIKFLSLEPLLSPTPNLSLNGIDWVIVGGESGPNARPMKKEWVVDIKNQCQNHDVPFFFFNEFFFIEFRYLEIEWLFYFSSFFSSLGHSGREEMFL
jgi:protein gp37